MGPIHDEFSPVSVYNVGNPLYVTQQSAITRRCNTNRFDFRVLCQGFFHIFRGNCGRQPLLRPPGPGEVDRVQIQQGQGIIHRPVAAPVNEHPVPPDRQQRARAVWSPSVEPPVRNWQQSIEKSSAHRRWAESKGSPAVEQVPGGTQLGHIQGGRPRQFRDGQGLPLVARDMEPDGCWAEKARIAS